MTVHAFRVVVVMCLMAAVPRLAQAQVPPTTDALPLKINDVIASGPQSMAPPLFGGESEEAPNPPDFPVGFLTPSPPWPAGVPTSAGLAANSGASQYEEAPAPMMIPETDPIEGTQSFWSDKPRFMQRGALWMRRMWDDQLNFYSWENAAWIVAGIAATAPIANTPADEHFRDWYQGRWGNNASMDKYALDVKNLGEGGYLIPAFLAGGAISLGMEQIWPEAASPISEWFGRTLRGWVAGAPTLLVTQRVLGASRPYVSEHASYWHPMYDSHGASGHTFMGAMPFLTAAEMVDNPWLKGAFIAGSFATGWSRIQTDDHFLSQVIMGWWIAYRAARCVSQSQQQERGWDIFPSVTPDGGAQVNVLIRF